MSLQPPQAHSLGLKLGIYEDMGKMTCMGYPGTTLDKVELDAETFAEWKVDMLKLDGCFSSSRERAEGESIHIWLGRRERSAAVELCLHTVVAVVPNPSPLLTAPRPPKGSYVTIPTS